MKRCTYLGGLNVDLSILDSIIDSVIDTDCKNRTDQSYR